jgi:DNA invertase Pin-like site-specific DNA recombinase
MKIGYVRGGLPEDKNTSLQQKYLQQAGCGQIYEEMVEDNSKVKPKVLFNLVENLKAEDQLLVWKLNCLSKSLRELIEIIHTIINKQAAIKILHNDIEITPTNSGFIFDVLAQFIQEGTIAKTQAGLAAIRARGFAGGKPPGLSKQAQVIAQSAEEFYLEKNLSVSQIAKQLGICKATLYAYLRYRKVDIGSYNSKKKTGSTETVQYELSQENQENHATVSWDPVID